MSSAGTSRLTEITIVIAEDNNDVRTTLTSYLAGRGARVLSSGNAFDGIETIRSEPPDLVLCDIGLPGCDGFQLLRWIREIGLDRGGNIPVVAMTALGPRAPRERTLKAGFQAHLSKPFTPDQLLKVISSLFEH